MFCNHSGCVIPPEVKIGANVRLRESVLHSVNLKPHMIVSGIGTSDGYLTRVLEAKICLVDLHACCIPE